jgi:hypothetical protein
LLGRLGGVLDSFTKNKAAILFETLPMRVGGFDVKEALEMHNLVDWLLDCERDWGACSLKDQLDWFSFLKSLGDRDKVSGIQSLRKNVVLQWSKQTRNEFGRAYSFGHDHGHIAGSFFTTKRLQSRQSFAAKSRTMSANNARKGMGLSSKQKVVSAFNTKYRKLSKEQAAIKISEDVGLAVGTVRRYLINA